MGAREEIQKRIEKKRAEISTLTTQIREAQVYIQALEDTLKMLPKDVQNDEFNGAQADLRPGSRVARAYDFIRQTGCPQQVLDILKGIGEEQTLPNRAALSGSIGAYVRNGRIFTRPAPNTFGLLEFGNKPTMPRSGPPPGFGKEVPPAEDDVLIWDEDTTAADSK
jgi:hypothetical protein